MAEYGMETSTIALQEKVQNPTSAGKLMLTAFWDSQVSSTGTLSGEGHNNKQCMVQWDAYWQAQACNSKQTPRTTVKRCCVVAQKCPPTYCCPRCWNAPENQVWNNDSSSVQSWFCPVWLPLVSSTQRGIKGPSIHLEPISEGSSACMAHCSAENLLFGGHQEAYAAMDQVRWNASGLCWKMMLKSFLFVLQWMYNYIADNYWLILVINPHRMTFPSVLIQFLRL